MRQPNDQPDWSSVEPSEIADGLPGLRALLGSAGIADQPQTGLCYHRPLDCLPNDFIDEAEVVSNVQDFTDVYSESAQTFRGVDPPMHYQLYFQADYPTGADMVLKNASDDFFP